MIYFLTPLAVVVAVAIVCLDVKAAFIVADRTEGTGFEAGFYGITLFGLLAAQVSLVAYLWSAL